MRSLGPVEISPEDTWQTLAAQEHDRVSQSLEVGCDWSVHGLTWLGIVAGYKGLYMLVSTCALLQTEQTTYHCMVGSVLDQGVLKDLSQVDVKFVLCHGDLGKVAQKWDVVSVHSVVHSVHPL